MILKLKFLWSSWMILKVKSLFLKSMDDFKVEFLELVDDFLS
jgi:hypothetical protein